MEHDFELRRDFWGPPDLYYQGKLVINRTMWDIFERNGFDMSRYVLNVPLPTDSAEADTK